MQNALYELKEKRGKKEGTSGREREGARTDCRFQLGRRRRGRRRRRREERERESEMGEELATEEEEEEEATSCPKSLVYPLSLRPRTELRSEQG